MEGNSKASSNNKVHLNVGGTKYTVSRSLIESFPNTMLARLVSDTWQTDPKSEIIIEADAEHFRYVLNYMRHEKVFLPLSVPKPALLQDLQYFGFQEVPPGAVDNAVAAFEAALCMSKIQKDHMKDMKDLYEKIKNLERKKACLLLAQACHKEFSENGVLLKSFGQDYTYKGSRCLSEQQFLYEAAEVASPSDPVGQECFGTFGLKLEKSRSYDCYSCTITFSAASV